MKYTFAAFAVIGALAVAVPASAQIVNGNAGGMGSPEAPVGTKGGGSSASMQAPGEAAAMAATAKNVADEKAMQDTGTTKKAMRRRRAKTSN